MPSDNRLQQRTLTGNYNDKDNATVNDPQNVNDASVLLNAVKMGLIAIAGYGTYKSGLLKGIIKPMLELGDVISEQGLDKASVVMSSIKKWANSEHIDSSALAKSGRSWNIPEHSLFHKRSSSVAFDLFQDISDLTGSSSMSHFNRMKRILQDTEDDLKVMHSIIEDGLSRSTERRYSYFDTDLKKFMQRLQEVEFTATEYHPDQASIYTQKMMEEFLELRSLTAEKAREQLRTTGYRQLVLGDILEEVIDSNGIKRLQVKSNAVIDLDKAKDQMGHSFLDSINNFMGNLNHKYTDEFGHVQTMYSRGAWKNLTLDSDIRIDEVGKFIDYRMPKQDLYGFINSLAEDFGLPVVKFNPLKSGFNYLGLNKLGYKEPFAGLLSSEQISPFLTERGGRYTIGEWLAENLGDEYANKSVAVINGSAYTTTTDGRLMKIAENLHLYDTTNMTRYGYGTHQINAMREMAGLSYGEPIKESITDYEKRLGRKLTASEKLRYRTAKVLDMGFEEWQTEAKDITRSFDSATAIDETTDRFIDRMTRKIRVNGFEYDSVNEMLQAAQKYDHSDVLGNGFGEYIKNNIKYTPHTFNVTKEGYKLGTVVTDLMDKRPVDAFENLIKFVGQFGSGFDRNGMAGKYFTERTTRTWGLFDALNNQLANSVYLFGFSTQAKHSVGSYAGNLIAKRALPIYMLTQVPDMINYLSEPFFRKDDETNTGKQDNITKFLMRKVVKPLDIQAHNMMDITGATKLVKFMQDMIPGTEQITELPLIHQMGLGQTKEERKEYIENGFDPIRKGRWWGAGNTPFTGGKIEYWRPNLYRRIEADVDFSDTKWGSRKEYYNHTWYPNIFNPLAPLNYFIFDKHHYDYKHLQDRPYLKTAPIGNDIPFIGPIFASTIGTIISPPQMMHMEYQGQINVNPADEQPNPILTTGKLELNRKKFMAQAQENINSFVELQKELTANQAAYTQAMDASIYQAQKIVKYKTTNSNGVTFDVRDIIQKMPSNSVTDALYSAFPKAQSYKPKPYTPDTLPSPYGYSISGHDDSVPPYEIYSTPSGKLSVVDIPNDMNLWEVNKDLKEYSIKKIIGAKDRVELTPNLNPDIPVGNDSKAIDNAFMYNSKEELNWLADVAGLKGFITQSLITGKHNVDARTIEDSGWAYSARRSFWDENMGGLGGSLSEISRRFMPKRNTTTEYINPIRNTMPDWMPGSNYFTDFKHGDPYTKIANGEERLPGEGYERMYGINNVLDMRTGSSSIGYDKEHIIRHLLHQDFVNTQFQEDTLNKGTKLHRQIEAAWKEQGIAFKTEGEIKDERNGILGYFDAAVYDMSSPTGVGIVDIKTTSAKKLKELRKSGRPLDYHKRQVNYYLWATGNTESKGYIHYVDKENPTDSYTVGFKYDDKLLRDTLKNLNDARADIRKGIEKGVIGRGDLYSPLDQYRILADVAPYSDEFKQATAKLSREQLTDEEKKEVQQIRKRITQQKEPLRVYPYKFKTSNLVSEVVTVDKILDNNTIVTKEYGAQHAIKFAGITVTESSDLVNKKEYPRKRRKGAEKIIHNIRKELEKGPTKREAAYDEIKKHIHKGGRITIQYDADSANKFSGDSTDSIRSVVISGGRNVNQILLNKGHAKENENDDSPAGIHARYSKGEIAFGSAMETTAHSIIGNIPFIGSKIYQVRSPYEQYRDREVYGKDFQSWDHPIRDLFMPNMVDKPIANGLLGIVTGTFIGRLFGRNNFGAIMGGFVGGAIPTIGQIAFSAGSTKERDWRPNRRVQQEKVNEYVDTLKYVKNMRLFNQYADKSMAEDHFDVRQYMNSTESHGAYNKIRKQELEAYKRQVKMDFKHSDKFDFQYGKPKYMKPNMGREGIIKAVNQEIKEIQSDRKTVKVPLNAMKAIQYKNAADKTMYGYEPGKSMVDIMSALPKKDRQYFKHFMNAPEEEKDKILRVAPSYMRRALQSTWGMKPDVKPSLQEYFTQHALPNANWVGWDENTNLDDVKVKLVHKEKLDPGEFDIWQDNKNKANMTNIPIPKIDKHTNAAQIRTRLKHILGENGYDDVQISYTSALNDTQTKMEVYKDGRSDVESRIGNMNI